MASKRRYKVAIAGNPNAGKTTIFNALTGTRQKIGNYPGVTVEQKIGQVVVDGVELEIIDLPGTYSLTAVSEEEIVARNYIIEEKPDIVVSVIDSSNLERNLYLAVQIMELGVRVVIALNMYDVARSQGLDIDLLRLSQLLGCKVVPTVANKKQGIEELKKAIVSAVRETREQKPLKINYGREIEHLIELLENELVLPEKYQPYKRWIAIKLIENDGIIIEQIRRIMPNNERIWQILEQGKQKISGIYGDSPEMLIADRRYGFISGVVQESTKPGIEIRHNISDAVDTVVTHPLLGLPLFLILMYCVFYFTFTLGEYPMEWIERGINVLSSFVDRLWANGSESVLHDLIVDGIIGGVGGVVVFLPNIILLYLGIALLEDTGYMARAAFVMDRFMHKIGLHGKSFIPMLIGFGCSVPAIMATRILENKRDRLTTIMIIPLMSCGARLTIYALFIPAFFPKEWQAPILWILYVTGIIFAVVLAKLLRVFVFKGESIGFVMELPPYRMPTFQGLLIHMWQRSWLYLKKAGTVILAISIILWALTSYPKLPAERARAYADAGQRRAAELKYSIAGRVGSGLSTILSPLGFDWRASTAVVGALAAKEVFVAQMGILFAMDEQPVGEAERGKEIEKIKKEIEKIKIEKTGHGENDIGTEKAKNRLVGSSGLRIAGNDGSEKQAKMSDKKSSQEMLQDKLRRAYTPLQAFCIMLFCLLSAPCIATLAVTKSETGSWIFALAQFFGLTILAYIVTFIVYQTGSLFAG